MTGQRCARPENFGLLVPERAGDHLQLSDARSASRTVRSRRRMSPLSTAAKISLSSSRKFSSTSFDLGRSTGFGTA